jgi:hypothetical protein
MNESEVSALEAGDHYFVKLGAGPYREVTRAEWIDYEHRAGFHSKFGPDHPATAGFSNGVIAGSTFNPRYSTPEQYDWKPELRAAIEEAMPSWR